MADVADLWLALDRALHDSLGETATGRLSIDPWLHDDPKVRTAWTALVAPENLPDLERWVRSDLNPHARRVAEEVSTKREAIGRHWERWQVLSGSFSLRCPSSAFSSRALSSAATRKTQTRTPAR